MIGKLRIVSVVVIFAAVVFLPYWVYLPLLGVAMFFFPLFWEGIIIALLIDVLYGGGVGAAREFFSPLAFGATVLLAALLPVKERIRINV